MATPNQHKRRQPYDPYDPPPPTPPDDRADPYEEDARREADREREANRKTKKARDNRNLVNRPRLGSPGFTVSHYVSYYGKDYLDAYRFSRLRVGDGDALTMTITPRNGRPFQVETRYGCWSVRWSHIGNLVKQWDYLPNEVDMPWARSEQEQLYAGYVRGVVESVVNGVGPLNYLQVDVF